jgi:regulator of protease activity HflC (stomatin/prohibitin superfamily)
MELIIVLGVLAIVAVVVLARAVRIVPQARAGIVERLGRYNRTLDPGLALLIPFIDRLRPLIDLREQVVSFPPQPVITEDNLVLRIDSVIYFQVTDAKAATYEIADYIAAAEQLTVTTLRNVIGGITLEETLTSRDQISSQLRVVLDEATGKWGLRVNRVEIKAIDPPLSIQEAMEKQMRAERDRRATILTAEGVKQSHILTAEGERQSAILRAEGQREAAILSAEGESKAIETVFEAIHRGDADPKLLAYQYLQMLPKIAEGSANKVWIVPSELTRALGGLGSLIGAGGEGGADEPARAASGQGLASAPKTSAESAGDGAEGPRGLPPGAGSVAANGLEGRGPALESAPLGAGSPDRGGRPIGSLTTGTPPAVVRAPEEDPPRPREEPHEGAASEEGPLPERG